MYSSEYSDNPDFLGLRGFDASRDIASPRNYFLRRLVDPPDQKFPASSECFDALDLSQVYIVYQSWTSYLTSFPKPIKQHMVVALPCLANFRKQASPLH